MGKTSIGWTDITWNPVHGCSKISEGCKNCYAADISLSTGMTEKQWTTENAEENVLIQNHKLNDPFDFKVVSDEDWAENIPNPIFETPKSGNHPTRVFVNSMSDL